MKELTFLKELMLVKQANQKSTIFVTIDIFEIKGLDFNQIGYLYNYDKVKLFHIILPQKRAYVKSYEEHAKWKNVLIEDDDLLEKYNASWDKVSTDMKK